MQNKVCIFDLDGTLYVDGVADDLTIELCNEITAHGWRLIYASNNTSKTVIGYETQLKALGFPKTQGNVLTPLVPLTHWLKGNHYKKVWVLAPHAVQEYIYTHGDVIPDPKADLVVVCFDKELTYHKLEIACELINSGIPYVVSHTDLVCPTKLGPIPDCGLIQKVLQSTTGIDPISQFGKPSFQYVSSLQQHFIKKDTPIYFVGDRLETDIKTGLSLGITPVLISEEDIRMSFDEHILVYPDVATFISKRVLT